MTTTSPFSLLVVDDEPDLRTLYELTLVREGYDVETAGTVEDALARLAGRQYSAVITDMRLPDGSGLDLLRHIEQNARPEKAIVITAYGSAENAVEALKSGAYDYLTKPVDLRQFRAVVGSALGRSSQPVPTVVPGQLPSALLEGVPAAPRGRAAEPLAAAPARAPAVPPAAASTPTTAHAAALARLVGHSPAMQQVRALIEKVSRSMAPVLVQGESGTGKELVASAIHKVSARGSGPFIAVNCGAIPENLLEAEFFGYRKGAFTGAADDREGFFQAAHGGTLFLDEIGDLPLSMQSKLLRAIQERAVRPVGAVNEAQVNVRIVSATHKDLQAEVQAGRFRQDLFYRLNVIQIRVPPLRERLDDLRPISAAVLERIARDAGVQPAPRLSDAAFEHLARYAFPGNVRELENLLQRAVALSGGDLIGRDDLGLPDAAFGDTQYSDDLAGLPLPEPRPAPVDVPLPTDLAAYLDEVERDILARALERHRYNRTAAGASLGLSLRQMRYRMARLGVTAGLTGAEAAAEGDDGV
ncbi:MAG: sigma-54-dependent Fis family transcriptional regulator [Aquincola sp.]|nr:sigma-54-dependent Fis family transcriptional regulator [Aquincola sp.]